MGNLYIKETKQSPLVYFNLEENKFLIKGCSVIENVNEFYEPLIRWIEDNLNQSNLDEINFILELSYFNIASSKRILFILYELAKLQTLGKNIVITWRSKNEDEDEDMKEVGEDYAFMVNLPFNFVSYNESEGSKFEINA